MTYKTVPLVIAGPSYKDRSRSLSAQETKNLYHEVVEPGKEKFVIKSFPGLTFFGIAGTIGEGRGQHQMLEQSFVVVGFRLYSVSAAGIHSDLGIIPGTSRCTFADDGINLFIVADGVVSQWNGVRITTVTDADISGALTVAYINNQFAYTKPLLTVFSDVGNGAIASSLNAVGAESNPDDLVRDYAFNEILYRFGTRVTEPWRNTGKGTPPFEKIQGQVLPVGLAATHAVANTKKTLYFLGTDRKIYKARGGQESEITSAAIAGEIQSYSVVSDCHASTITFDNKTFVIFTFPNADKTWILNEELGVNGWFELSAGTSGGQYNGNSFQYVYGSTLVGDRINGKLYKLDFNSNDQAGESWQRRRVLSSINGDIVGQKGARIQISRVELIMEMGVGLISGQGSDPKIMIEYSVDGAASWKPGTWMQIGRLGDHTFRARWNKIINHYDIIIRLTVTDPIPINIYSGTVDIRLAGGR